jgi:acetyl-CoA C-acetyltransferase
LGAVSLRDVYVAGVGQTSFGRYRGPAEQMLVDASLEAIEAAANPEFEAIVVGAMAPELFGGEGHIASKLLDALGRAPMPAFRVENGPATGGTAFQVAVQAVASGHYSGVLVAAAEKMTHIDSARMAALLGGLLPATERAAGLTMPGLAAMLTRLYMEETGLTREQLAQLPVKAHRNGKRNPKAHFRDEVTAEEVLGSPMVADPLRRLDCAPLSDGAAAVLVTARSQPVRVAGTGQANDIAPYALRADLSGFAATRHAARTAFKRARKRPNDIDLIETHDAFSVLELVNLEDMGFFERGQAIAALELGEFEVDGALPVNPSGGLKARGHPLSATGLAQVAEVYLQLAGKADHRQVDATAGIAQNIGGFGTSVTVSILEIG